MGLRVRRAVVVAGMAVLVCAAFAAGRLTTSHQDGGRDDGGALYVAGMRAGEALGLREGRALQEGAALPATARQPVADAFTAGYSAGMNDVFSGYDGGWLLGVPYVITLERADGATTYRIRSREQVATASATG